MNISINKLSKYFFFFFGLTSSAIFIYNIFSYYSFQAPDGDAHNEYVYYLSIYLPDNLKLPSMSDTYEYFSPPLAYFFPALGIVLCRNLFTSEDYKTDCLDFYDNLGQAFLFFLFIIYIITLFYISKRLFKDYLKFFIPLLILTLSLSVNYQMFSSFRGETYILLFSSFVFLLLLKISQDSKINNFDYLYLGILIGLMLLSRQWSVFFLPTIFTFWVMNKTSTLKKRKMFYMLFISGLIGFLIASPFYISLQEKEDSIVAWNGDSYEIDIKKYPLSFYTNLGFSEGYFTNPTISNPEYDKYIHGRSIIPTFLSTIWGDPNGYFSYTHLRYLERNQTFEKYLGFVNLLGLSFIILFTSGLIKFLKSDKKNDKDNSETLFFRLIIFNFISTFIFYIVWMYLYLPSINANYMLQITNLLPFFGAYFIYKIKDTKNYNYVLFILLIMYFSLLPTFIYGSSYLIS